MDFWAQHKDFVLKVLAGLGVFLVALIARQITYGDELEKALRTNQTLAGKIRGLEVADLARILQLEQGATRLRENANRIRDEIGINGASDDLELDLLRRTLSYLRRYRGEGASDLEADARAKRAAIRANLNGGFGELRLTVRDELIDEASENNVGLQAIGFENVTSLAEGQLMKYLLQLELAARVLRYTIDARVDAVEAVQIQQEMRGREVIPGANPEFLREYEVTIRFRSTQEAALQVVNRLQSDRPAPVVPLRSFTMDRLERPRDHVAMELKLLAVASDTEVAFLAPKEEEGR